ncbi:MAG: alpha/beta hydrolase [Dehalococcoidia bacterium]|nr:alpha/beta hydrolase [Dehalococcoidia bacterium]
MSGDRALRDDRADGDTRAMVAARGAELFACSSGHGPAIVFLHAFGFDHTMWEPQRAWFARAHQTVAYDYRGMGRSTAAATGYSWDQFADDCLAVMDAHGVARATLVGLSFGVVVAVRVALRAPQRVAGLALADGGLEGATDAVRLRLLPRIATILATGVDPGLDDFIARCYSPEYRSANPTVASRHRERYARHSPVGLVGGLIMLATRPSLLEAAACLTAPTQIIVGDRDEAIAPGAAERAQRAIPGAELTVIAGAGHLANEERPAQFNAAVDALVRRAVW